MATATWTANKDTTTADNGTNLGAGAQNYLPIGNYSGYNYRGLLAFAYSFAGIISIESAILHMRVSDQGKVAFGSDPDIDFYRLTSAFTEGSATSLSASNATTRANEPGTGTHAGPFDVSTTQNAWVTFDITAILQGALSVGAFYGVSVRPNTNATSDVTEFWTREAGSAPYIVVTYTTNRAPNAPTISSPDVANGGLVGTTTPTLNVNLTDPDGDAINQFNWQIDDNADFSSPIQDVYSGSPVGASGITVPVVPAALARGGTYYFRARAADVSVWGGWSGTFQFKVASYPTLTVSEPSAAGRLARLQYDAGSGWVSPRMLVNWAMTCPDGGSQATWRVEVFNDNGSGGLGTSLDDATANDTTAARIVPANLVEGNYYHVRVTATCSHGLTTVVGPTRVRARWGVVTHRLDMTTPPGSLSLAILDVTDSTNTGSGRVVVEYMTTTGAAPTTWQSSIASAGLNQFFYYRVWLLVWGASPAVSPTLNELKISYSTATITPDKWTLQDAANASGDEGTFVYGTQSLRMKGKGSAHNAYQSIPVVPNTNYILSARIQTQGNPLAQVVFSTGPTSGGVIGTPNQVADILFEDPRSRLASTVWNSGANTSIFVRCVVSGPVGSTAWFDAIKVEASVVVTPWSPGYIANAVVLDAGGLQIDASNGGIFRLKGASGGARDIVELGNNGLKFGGDTEMYSGAAGLLQTNGGLDSLGAHTGPYHLAGSGSTLRISGDGASTGKWAHIANGTITNQYWSQHVHGFVQGRYGTYEVAMSIGADAGMGGVETPVGLTARNLFDSAGRAPMSFKITIATRNPLTWHLWFQAIGNYETYEWHPTDMFEEGNDAVITNPATLGWIADTSPYGGVQYLSSAYTHQFGGNLNAAGSMTAGGFIQAGGSGLYAPAVYEGSTRLIEPAGLFIQRGVWTVGASAGSITITFPIPFNASNTPTCMAAMRSGSRGYICNTGGQNNTVMSIVVGTNGGAVPTVALSGDWLAVGIR